MHCWAVQMYMLLDDLGFAFKILTSKVTKTYSSQKNVRSVGKKIILASPVIDLNVTTDKTYLLCVAKCN